MDDLVPDLAMPPAPDDHLWADEALLIVKRVDPSDGPGHVVGGVVSDWSGVDVTAAEAAYYAKAPAWNSDREVFNDHVLTERRTDFEWGASFSSATWILEVAKDVSTEAVLAGILYAIHKIRGRYSGQYNREPLTLEMATDKARQSIALVYDLDVETLKVTGDSRSSDGREIKVTFASDNGPVYWGRVALLGGLYLTAEVGTLRAKAQLAQGAA